MKKFKGLMISTAVLLCTAIAGAFQANADFKNSIMRCSGDVNMDGEFTVADAVSMQQYLLNSYSDYRKFDAELHGIMSSADLNFDGEVNVFDFIIMRDHLVNPVSQNVSWTIDDCETDSKEAYEIAGNEYMFTSYAQLEEYLDYLSSVLKTYDYYGFYYTEYSETYTADFFEDNILLMKPVCEDVAYESYTITRIFYDDDVLNIDYRKSYYGEDSKNPEDIVLLQVAVPKSLYHAEQISWNSEETDWRTVFDRFKENITQGEFLDLLQSKEEFTWFDFEPYKSENIGSGTYVLKYEIEYEDSNDNCFLYICGDSIYEKPESIYIETPDGKTIDIYEFRKVLNS